MGPDRTSRARYFHSPAISGSTKCYTWSGDSRIPYFFAVYVRIVILSILKWGLGVHSVMRVFAECYTAWIDRIPNNSYEALLGINRGSYMSAHVLLNLLNELGKKDKMRGLPSILSIFATSLINSIIQEHEY